MDQHINAESWWWPGIWYLQLLCLPTSQSEWLRTMYGADACSRPVCVCQSDIKSYFNGPFPLDLSSPLMAILVLTPRSSVVELANWTLRAVPCRHSQSEVHGWV
ncbi:hypothetical protein BJX70DRAFT_325250 [Aspergillus crustosus]